MAGFQQERLTFDMALLLQAVPEGLKERAIRLLRRETEKAHNRHPPSRVC
jgi:hypothetical protein